MRGFVVGRSVERRIYFNEINKRAAGKVSAAPDLPDLREATWCKDLVSSRGVLVRWIILVTKEQTWS